MLLTNSFHNTKIRIHDKTWFLGTNQLTVWQYLTYRATLPNYPNTHFVKAQHLVKAQVRRIRKKLCGIDGCTCGTVR